MPPPTPNHCWYHLTPARFFTGLLAAQIFLLLSERFQWFPFNTHKGWTVLIAVGVVGLAVVVVLLWGLICLLFRRRFQFSFRSLLVFLVGVSIPLGWLAMQMQKARRQGEAVEAIKGAGGFVFYDYDFDENGNWIRGAADPATPPWLRRLLGDDFFCEVVTVVCDETEFGDNEAGHLRPLRNLEGLWLSDTPITDKGLAHLEGMTTLERLALGKTAVTDVGLAHLAGMTRLRELRLCYTQVGDKGLAHVKGMTDLKKLWLDGAQVTDKGLTHLGEMVKLEYLSLSGTQITDKGLGRLKTMTELKELCVSETQVTDEGERELQAALPDCKIWLYDPA
jgi:hypothetical protein